MKYVNDPGFLIRSLESVDATRVLTAALIKTNKEGIKSLKSKSYISAIKYWHAESNFNKVEGHPEIEITKDLNKELEYFQEGKKRCNASVFANGEFIEDNSKLPLTFEGYQFLGKYSLLSTDKNENTLLNHLYMLLCWNLIARSSTIGDL